MMMAKCKYPGCKKILIGKEKHFCTSCVDKIKSGAWTGVKWTGKALAALVVLVPTALAVLAKMKSDD